MVGRRLDDRSAAHDALAANTRPARRRDAGVGGAWARLVLSLVLAVVTLVAGGGAGGAARGPAKAAATTSALVAANLATSVHDSRLARPPRDLRDRSRDVAGDAEVEEYDGDDDDDGLFGHGDGDAAEVHVAAAARGGRRPRAVEWARSSRFAILSSRPRGPPV